MKIALGTDHAGFLLKEKIRAFLEREGHAVMDFGTFSEDAADYPVFIRPAALSVTSGEADRGIVLGGSGNGEAMVANRIPGIRCALCWNTESARLAREHNDANVISLGARMIPPETALEIVKIWLETPFEGGRHLRRIHMIDHPPRTAAKPDTEGPAGPEAGKHDILIAFRYIKYMEGDRAVEFEINPSLKGPSVVRVPSPSRWQSEMPGWARDRREEILERVTSRCSHMVCTWEEY